MFVKDQDKDQNQKQETIYDLLENPNISLLSTKMNYHKHMLKLLGLHYNPTLAEHFYDVAWSDSPQEINRWQQEY